jgi:hypothetical protein
VEILNLAAGSERRVPPVKILAPIHGKTRLPPVRISRRAIGLLIAIFSAFVLAAAPQAQAAEEELGTAAWTLPVPSGVSQKEVREAIVAALLGRQWAVQSQTDDKVVGYLKHRGNEAQVTFIYTANKVDVFCLGWQINKAGQRQKPEQPKGWLNNLKADLTKGLNKLATTK